MEADRGWMAEVGSVETCKSGVFPNEKSISTNEKDVCSERDGRRPGGEGGEAKDGFCQPVPRMGWKIPNRTGGAGFGGAPCPVVRSLPLAGGGNRKMRRIRADFMN
jgi:hypothetical protein